ncbi:MAG TPA: hypothetical protein VGE52_10155 [Pirellulales bacterium]
MSMFTSLMFYRPAAPKLVTVGDLAHFVAALESTNLIEPKGQFSAEIHFGREIARDEWIDVFEEDGDEGDPEAPPKFGRTGKSLKTGPLTRHSQLVNWLRDDPTPVYRAFIELGALTEAARQIVARDHQPSDEAFSPEWLFLHVGPVDCSTFDDEDDKAQTEDRLTVEPADNEENDGLLRYPVGWMELSVSGFGWLFPWTLRQAKDKMESRPEFQALMELCRTTWPMTPQLPDEQTIAMRKAMGGLWPYDDLRRPHDWSWGIAET